MISIFENKIRSGMLRCILKSSVFFGAIVLMLTSCGNSSTVTNWQEQYDLGMQYLIDGDYEAAIVAFTAAIEIDAKDVQAYTGLVQAYIGTGDYESAAATAGQGAKAFGDSVQEQADGAVNEFTAALLTLGELCLGEGDYESSETIYSLIIGIDENLVDAYIGRADMYLLLGEQEKALEDYRKALELLQQGGSGSITEDELETLIAKIMEDIEGEESDIDEASSEIETNGEEEGIIYVLTETYEVHVIADWSYELRYEYIYDELGRKISSIGYETDPGIRYVTEYLLADDKEELPSHKYMINNSGEVLFSEEYIYDDVNNLINYVTYDRLGDIVDYYEYTYDDYGNVVTEYWYYEEEIRYDYQYTYDLNGNVLNKIQFLNSVSENREKLSECIYVYDENGNIMSYTYVDYINNQVTSQSETTYTYENDRLMSIITYQDGEEKERTEYSYDEHGNIVTETIYSYGELRWQYEYIYTAISK